MLKIPKLIQTLDLSGYDPQLAGETLQIWVDPPRRLRQDYDELLLQVQQEELARVSADATPTATPSVLADISPKTENAFLGRMREMLNLRAKSVARREGTDVRILKWYSNLWSQEGRGMTLEELKRIEEENPAFLGWLIQETWRMIHDNQVRLKKN